MSKRIIEEKILNDVVALIGEGKFDVPSKFVVTVVNTLGALPIYEEPKIEENKDGE